jgi:hypothetical protein
MNPFTSEVKTKGQKILIAVFSEKYLELYNDIKELTDSRYKSLAITMLEESNLFLRQHIIEKEGMDHVGQI